MDKENVEYGRNGADHPKLFSPSLQCLCCDQSRMLGEGCVSSDSSGTFCARKKILCPEHNKKKILLNYGPQLGSDLQALQAQR